MRHPEERKCGKEKNSEEEKKEGGMPLIKTLSQALKMDKERFQVPKSVQQAVPIRRIWPDGIFQVGNKYSKSFRFTDINYAIASKADKTEMFLDYSELLNPLVQKAVQELEGYLPKLQKGAKHRNTPER